LNVEDQTLIRSQKNLVFSIIEEEEFNPIYFSWSETIHEEGLPTGGYVSSYRCSVLKYNDEGYFEFNSSGKYFKPKYSPGEKQKTTYITDDYLGWDSAIRIFRKWLGILKTEYGQPDFWKEVGKRQPFVTLQTSTDNTLKFSNEEVDQIKDRLREIKLNIEKNFELTSEQNNFLAQQIEYLVDSAKKQTIRDWRNILLGTIFSIATNLAISPDKLQMFSHLFDEGFKVIRHLIGY